MTKSDTRFCVDCKHIREEEDRGWVCNKFPSPVTGKPFLACWDLRKPHCKCGPDGYGWEKKE